MREETGLSRTGFKQQVRKLESQGFLTMKSRFTDAGRQTSNHYQLHMGGVTHSDPTGGHKLQTPHGSQAGDPPDIGNEIQEGNTNCDKSQETPLNIEELLNQQESLSREDIFRKALRKDDKLTPDGCAYLWRNCRASAGDNGFQAELLVKDKKMLHNAYKRVGEDFNLAVWAVMSNWIAFTKFAADSYEAFNLPHFPTISFFTKFIEAAVAFHETNSGASSSDFVQVTANPSKPLTKPKEIKDNEHTAITSDELAAISGELE